MKYLVLGANQFGYAVVYDLVRSPKVDEIFWADVDVDSLHRAMEHFVDKRIIPCALDVNNLADLEGVMSRADVAISCLSPQYSYELSKVAIQSGAHFCDLGGDEEEARKQFLLNDLAKDQDVAIVPAAGLAPGLLSVLAAAAYSEMTKIYEIRFRAGILPVENEGRFISTPVVSTERLINDLVEDSTLIREEKLIRLPAISEYEQIDLPTPFGCLEAFNTAGGMSRLIHSMAGKVQNVDYKSIHYPGYGEQVHLLRDLGLFSSTEMTIDGAVIAPRTMMAKLIREFTPKNEPDVVIVRVQVAGMVDDSPVEILWECMDYMDQGAGILAAARMNSFPLSIVAQMLARGDIQDRGVLAQEIAVPVKLYLAELASRGINLSLSEKTTGSASTGNGKKPPKSNKKGS